MKKSRLQLNIDASGTGYATVALVNEKGESMAGFTHEDCELIHADEIDYPVRWKSGDQMPAGIHRIEIRLRSARIWAIEIAK